MAASGVAGLGAAATQIVCDISLTNVTRRRGPLAAAALGAAAAESACDDRADRDDWDAGLSVIRTTVGAAAVWTAASAAAALPAGCVALAPPAGTAQPEATVTAASTAAVPTALVISALVNRPGHRLPCLLNVTGILPALGRSWIGDGRRHPEITENAAGISVIWQL